MSKSPSIPERRHQARCLAMQALYQWHFNPMPAADLLHSFKENNDCSKADIAYFETLVSGTLEHLTAVEAVFTPFIQRPLTEIDPIALATIRYTTYELMHQLSVPLKVALNEALNVVKTYGPSESFRFVNAVLHKVGTAVRSLAAS